MNSPTMCVPDLAVNLEPVTFGQWLDELLDLSLELERHRGVSYFLIETASGEFFVWAIWLSLLVH